MEFTPAVKRDYEKLFTSCKVSSRRAADVDALVDRIAKGRKRLEATGQKFGVPWHVLGIIQLMEGGGSFTRHLHNGDPLTARTVQVPKGRPKKGNPPFTWEDSAADAIQLEGLDKQKDWSPGAVLYLFEKYNGFGYRNKKINIPSPYLWSFSNHYTKGKYSSDGHYDPNLVSQQCGTAVLLHRMMERGLIDDGAAQKTKVLRRGSQGPHVRELKKQLRKWFDKNAPGEWEAFGIVDNDVFGAGLENAVKEFQQRRGIQSTGRVGKKTLDTLNAKPVTKKKAPAKV
ncbi:MAG TPA: peptidoglycan-binding protein [Gaiellaceae bacterium]|jgi:lysozyme family protein